MIDRRPVVDNVTYRYMPFSTTCSISCWGAKLHFLKCWWWIFYNFYAFLWKEPPHHHVNWVFGEEASGFLSLIRFYFYWLSIVILSSSIHFACIWVDQSRGATPMQSKWIKLDLNISLVCYFAQLTDWRTGCILKTHHLLLALQITGILIWWATFSI